MQFLFNFVFNVLSKAFSALGNLAFPSWLSDIVSGLSYYIKVLNWFFPISTYFTVAIAVIGVVLILMIVSALLQLL